MLKVFGWSSKPRPPATPYVRTWMAGAAKGGMGLLEDHGRSFAETLVNESLVRDLAGGDFLAHQRNVVLVGGTGQLRLPPRRNQRCCG
jgi:hypothetical protein